MKTSDLTHSVKKTARHNVLDTKEIYHDKESSV